MAQIEARIYGVSSGDGNNGVSHMFADYYVRTNDPWRLARLAAVSTFNKGEGQAWAVENMLVDGEAEYTISAVFYESPKHQDERAKLQEQYDAIENDESEEAQELEAEIEGYDENSNGAWLIFEVFIEEEPRNGRPMYDSLEEAFEASDLLLVPVED